jgi:hypothetical protein
LRHPGVLPNGARRIRTADLLGAMHEGRLVGSREKSGICSVSVAIDRGCGGSIYARICSDMKGVRHFWREVPEIRRAGSSAPFPSQGSFGCARFGELQRRQEGSRPIYCASPTPRRRGWLAVPREDIQNCNPIFYNYFKYARLPLSRIRKA